MFDLLHPSCLGICQQHFQALTQRAPPQTFQTEFVTKDGRTITVEGNFNSGEQNGKPGVIRGIFRDVTERKRAEESLRKSEEMYRALVEQAPDAIFIAATDLHFIELNARACELSGYTRDEILQMSIPDFMTPEDVVSAPLKLNDLREGKTVVAERRLRQRDGTLVPVEVTTKFLSDGRMQSIVRDITERKQAEAALRASEANYRTLVESASDAILVVDTQGRFADVNAAGCRMFGYTREELLTMSTGDIVTADEAHRVAPEIARLGIGEVVRSDWKCRRKDGAILPVEASATMLPDGRLLGILRDVTERKQAEAALHESEERYRTLFETAPDGIAVFDSQMKIAMTNRRAVEIYGYANSAEMVGLSAYDLIAPQVQSRARQNARGVIDTGQMPATESIGVKKDGTQFAAESSATLIPNSEGRPLAIIGVTRDITERKLAEEQLQASHEQLRALSARLQSAREEEGARIAREIHDELGGALTGLKWDLEGIDKVLSKAGNGAKVQTVREKLPNMTGLIDSTISTVRRISAELRPGVLDDLGLVAAIEWQASQFQTRTGIKCECVCGMHAEEQYAVRAFKAGASGYISKGSSRDELRAAILKVIKGGRYVSPALAEHLVVDFATSDKAPHSTLSDRELEVLCLIASGKTVGEIAAALHSATRPSVPIAAASSTKWA